MSRHDPSVSALPDLDADRAGLRLAWCVAGLLLVPILLVRLGWLRWMEYSGDEAYFLARAFQAIHEGVAYGYGTSAGVRVPPFFVYLVGVPLFFTHDPVVVAAFIAVLNLGGLVLLYYFARALLGARSAILVTLLMATSPWSVMFSRKIWNLDAIFPLVIALHLVLLSNMSEYRRWKVVLAFALFGAASQIHPSVGLLLVPLVLLHTLLRAPIRWGDLGLGLGVLALIYAPYIGYLWTTDFDNLRYVLSLGAKGEGNPNTFMWRLYAHGSRPFEISSGTDLEALLGFGARPQFLAQPAARLAEFTGRVLLVAMVVAGVLAVWWSILRLPRAIRGASSPPAERYFVFLSITLVTSIVTAATLGMFPNQHYYVFLYPIVPVFFVWALEHGLRAIRAPAWSVVAVVAAIAAVQVTFMLTFLESLRTDPEVQNGSLSVFYAPKREQCERELAQRFDDILHGDERRRAVDAERAQRFEASSDTLLRVDPVRNEPRVEPYGRTEIEPSPEGLLVRGGSALDMAALPEFTAPQNKSVLLRLELTSPDEAILIAFFQTLSDPHYSHRKFRDARLQRGRNTVFLELDAEQMTNQVLLRLEVHRYVIHALEARAVER